MKTASPSLLRRHGVFGLGLSAAAAGAGVAWWRLQPDDTQPLATSSFWEHTFERPEGGQLRMTELRHRPLLVNFWATWCPPCVEELPMLESFWQQHAAKGLQVVGLAIDQAEAVRRFVARQSLSFPMGLAGLAGTQLSKELGNTAGGLPFTLFFSGDGSISRKKLGQLKQKDLDDWLMELQKS